MKYSYGLVLIFLSAFCVSHIGAQIRHFEGRVLSTLDSLPLYLASVSNEAEDKGVVTNRLGEFHLVLDSLDQSRYILIQYLGYTNEYISTDSAGASSEAIYLRPDPFSLSEVVVSARNDRSEEILRECVSQMRSNYSRKTHLLTSFLRESSRNEIGGKFTSLLEAILEIQKSGFHKRQSNVKIRLLELRKTKDYAKYPILTRIMRYFFRKGDTDLHNLMRYDPIKCNIRGEAVKFIKPFSQYDTAYYIGQTTYDGSPTHIVGLEDINIKATLFICESDHALLEAKYLFTGMHPLKTPEEEINYKEELQIKYRRAFGTYHLFHQSYFRIDDIRLVDGKRSVGYRHSDLTFTSIQPSRKNFDKIKRRDRLVEDVKNISSKYNADFWRNTNTFLMTPLDQNLVRDLEFEYSLEDQFHLSNE